MKCEKGLTFEECELAILRHAVDKIEKKTGRKMIGNPIVQEIISIVEKFLIKKLILVKINPGGTCWSSGIVYTVRCRKCDLIYVGETGYEL